METSIPTPPYDDQHNRPQPSTARKSPTAASATLASTISTPGMSSSSSASTPSAATPSAISVATSATTASSAGSSARTAKSGNGSGSNTTGNLIHSTSPPLHPSHHHSNSHRASKRASTTPSVTHSHHSAASQHGSTAAHSQGSPQHHDGDGRHKRVWKACERCRMKKTKCDGEFPCKRCKDDGLVCTAGTRKKTEYKQLPKGYAEVLENTQFALVATVHKLYAMVRASQAWDLGEPELNERGQPVIHSIAAKLGCIRPNNDPDLPMGATVFPEDESDLAELASQLEEQQKHREAEQAIQAAAAAAAAAATAQLEGQQQQQQQQTPSQGLSTQATSSLPLTLSTATSSAILSNAANGLDLSSLGRFDRASSSEELDGLSDMDDYRRNVFGSANGGTTSSINSTGSAMSPQSLTFTDFDVVSTQSDGFVAPSPTLSTAPFTNWMAARPASMDLSAQSLQQVQQQQHQLQVQQQQQQQQAQAQQLQAQAQVQAQAKAQAQAQVQQLQAQQQQAQRQQQQQRQLCQKQQQQQQRQQQQQQQQQAPRTQTHQKRPQSLVMTQSPLSMTVPSPLATSVPTMAVPFVQSPSSFFAVDLLQQGLVESNFGTIKPHVLSCPNPEVMLGIGDPMIYSGGYDDMM